MSYVIKEAKLGNERVRIVQDEYAETPRNWSNLGTMVCFHRTYSLGDNHNYIKDNYNSWSELKKHIIENEDTAIILPIYMLDHSGITINTTGFSCPWDSMQIGYIFISKEKLRKEYGIKRVTKKWIEQVTQHLLDEVKTYDMYISGEVYGYVVEDEDENVIDSCYGFFGGRY